MTIKEKTAFVKQQLAKRWKCETSAFDLEENMFYATEDTYFEIVTFGHNAIIRGEATIVAWCQAQFGSTLARDILDGDNLYDLDTKLRSVGKKLAGEHMRYLHYFPDEEVKMPEEFEYKLYVKDGIKELYEYKFFDNALTFERDEIALAAWRGNELAAMAGTDEYVDGLWEIGIDTVPKYRKLGLGRYLVKQLALEIEKRNKVPFYNTWSPNIASVRLALGAGFRPVWMEYPSTDI